MIAIYRCQLELHDSLYYATREIGRLYETEAAIHNYALCYALGLVDSEVHGTTVALEDSYCYFCPEQIPKYKVHLTPLNQQNIYVTPARSLFHSSTLNTWKYANNNYHVEMEKTQKNIPGFGRTKEIAPESQFEFFIISEKELKLPKWVRLGKWASKAELKVVELPKPKRNQNQEFTCPYPLNPLDVMFTHQVISYDTINMPPVSLIRNVRMRGDFYNFEGTAEKIQIPARMQFYFGG
ncbi:type I-D CRISPR-associated protein Cas5/Csc1 [Desertifilum sp. FACHB-1129]|uniref:Type I-D CRISPR-associated protein Cas5/Csc1 n=3 Tax=Cyanophyceae TaxID=3028117 RepID=A0A1E5QHS9_9CYAN|nr:MULTISPECIES: type I-D CRISPR-associated protein Cas5/Csc1 [Cyanophyceae]MDA0209603.1 type I-D CRISPR-associated protein Cas5/Csc1 [Cyanobacteria bacterium FC1]MDK3159157.1 type I-D CRISPR-associated protein Cas5/Csc1 [Kamptonema cortianum]NES98584.1 type I-D CRISPR-associated protein Cas5/Csc1 [Desertifilum sp. SIO1I2]MBD2313013.1 type I-D CRISPR-associated protein Cas5/Csc1 [Desertifilum sp. FACHB-1129]MBD2320941.1 type I-D CRISPR-associated protein Cas5/Csc1 [Desertifilum sp. FACHB-866]